MQTETRQGAVKAGIRQKALSFTGAQMRRAGHRQDWFRKTQCKPYRWKYGLELETIWQKGVQGWDLNAGKIRCVRLTDDWGGIHGCAGLSRL